MSQSIKTRVVYSYSGFFIASRHCTGYHAMAVFWRYFCGVWSQRVVTLLGLPRGQKRYGSDAPQRCLYDAADSSRGYVHIDITELRLTPGKINSTDFLRGVIQAFARERRQTT